MLTQPGVAAFFLESSLSPSQFCTEMTTADLPFDAQSAVKPQS